MELNQTLTHLVSLIAEQLATELAPRLNGSTANPDTSQAAQLASLRQENQTLSTKLTHLSAELASIKAQLASPASQAAEQPGGPTEAQLDLPAGKTAEPEPGQAEAETVDEARAERWVRENTHEWLDQPCSFKRAAGRTWRELATNAGGKIAINGRGPQSPRAYLHAIESWQKCNVWSRVKARVALEVGKQEAEQN